MLDRLGYRVTVARNGVEAVTACDGGSFDLLLAEAIMSRLNGHDLAEMVRDRQPRMRALFLADTEYERLARKAASRRGVRFLCRPFTMATLSTAVRQALDVETGRALRAGTA